jgi:peptidoglycan/LPS O-acetylase OafA/YrhL
LVGWRSCLPGADYGLIILPAVVLGLTKNVGLIQNWLGNRWNVFGGEISYSLYMTHSLSEKLLKILFPLAKWQGYCSWVGILIILAHFLVMLLVAVACYYAVEKPARYKIRMLLER